MRLAVYPGTFDPVTYGHLDLVERGRNLFENIVIAVLHNEEKRPLFDLEQRVALVNEAVAGWDNVTVDSFDGLLVDYATQKGAVAILRGIRAFSDFEYEMQMTMMNRKLKPGLETVFMVPNETYSYVSSRLVREISHLGGSIDGLVPPNVARALSRAHGRGV